jgi:DNA polymerase III sliding clamp (beta) subunit (PCNA family)
MTRAVFETATIADAIRSAEKVAPNKGQAFDKAAGILMEIDPANGTVVVRATNTEIFHMAWIDSVELDGAARTWLFPSKVFAGLMAALPIGSGKNVTFDDKDGSAVYVESGRTKAKFQLMSHEYYPTWGAFDPDGLFPAKDMGGRISQVEWAAAKAEVPISGVHLDGEWAVCTDRYRCARVPLSIPDLTEPITIPAGLLGQVLKQTGEILIGVSGDTLLIMPDEHTQIRTVVYGQKFPAVKRIMKEQSPAYVTFKKQELLEVVNRTMTFGGAERTPRLRVFLGNEEIACMMSDVERGMIGDVVEVPGYCTHDRFEIRFTPKNLTDALNAAPNDEVTIGYDPQNPKSILHVAGGSGFDAWIMPLDPNAVSASG